MRTCTKCGSELQEDSRFCMKCGEPANSPQSIRTPYGSHSSGKPLNFAENYLSFAVLGALFLVLMMISNLSSRAAIPISISTVFKQYDFFGAIALAVAVSARAKGPDLSIGSLIALSGILFVKNAASGSSVAAVLGALLLCALIGAFNGALIVYAKIPAVITTLITGVLVRGVCFVISDEKPLMAPGPFTYGESAGLGHLLPTLIQVLAFALIFFTKLGRPYQERREESREFKLTFLLSYAASAVFAALIGFDRVERVHSAIPGAAGSLEPFILFAYFTVTSSKLLDNRFGAAIYATTPAFIWAFLTYVSDKLDLSSYQQMMVQSAIVLAFGAVKFFAIERKKAIPLEAQRK